MKVRKKVNGAFFVDFHHNNKRIRETIKHATTMRDAEKAASVIVANYFRDAYNLNEKPRETFSKFCESVYLPYSKANKKSYEHDVCICKALTLHFGKLHLDEINFDRIERYKRTRCSEKTRKGTKRAPSRVNKEIAVLSKILTIAKEQKFIADKPTIKLFRVSDKRERVLSQDEEKRLLKELDAHELTKRIVLFALHTGMRQGEIFNLTWFDVDFTSGLLHLRDTKSGKPRNVPMNEFISAMLSALPKKSEFVFANSTTGKKLVTIKRSFDSARTNANLKDFRFHDLRHTAASRMSANGADAFTLAKIFGWSDIRIALRYTHSTLNAQRQAVESLVENLTFGRDLGTNEKGNLRKLP